MGVELLIAVAVIATAASLVIPRVTQTGSSDNNETTTMGGRFQQGPGERAEHSRRCGAPYPLPEASFPARKEGCVDALVNGIDVPFAGSSTHYQLSGMGPG